MRACGSGCAVVAPRWNSTPSGRVARRGARPAVSMCCLCACLVSQKLRWLCCALTVLVLLSLAALSLFGACSLGLLRPETRWCCVFSTKDVTCLGNPEAQSRP